MTVIIKLLKLLVKIIYALYTLRANFPISFKKGFFVRKPGGGSEENQNWAEFFNTCEKRLLQVSLCSGPGSFAPAEGMPLRWRHWMPLRRCGRWTAKTTEILLLLVRDNHTCYYYFFFSFVEINGWRGDAS